MSSDGITELVAFCQTAPDGSSGPSIVDSTVDSFFASMREQHEGHVEQIQSGGVETASSKSLVNQRRLYLDEHRWNAALQASRKHLESHPSWVSGRSKLPAKELRVRVALQHYTSVDVEDLGLPEDDRRSDDTFTEQGIAKQFLLDVACSSFLIGEERFCFFDDLQASGVEPAADEGFDQRLRAFENKVITALLAILGDDAPEVLVQAVSRSMSQSGIANIERACGGPQVVISGGEQKLCHELLALAPGHWELRTTLRKSMFEQAVVIDETCADESHKVVVLPCGSESQISRGCSIRFLLRPRPSGAPELQVDVCDVAHQVKLVDMDRRPLRLPGEAVTCLDKHWSKASRLRAMGLLNCHVILWRRLWDRCTQCRRRAHRLATEVLPQGISMTEFPSLRRERSHGQSEDVDGCIRAPLRDQDAPV